MKGVIGAKVVKTVYGNWKILIECTDRDTAEKVVRKLRMVGLFAQFKESEIDG